MKLITKISIVLYLQGVLVCCAFLNAKSQNIAITDDDSYTANPSAMLDVKSTSKGMLVPRLTSAQRAAIGSPAIGLLVYDTTLNSFMYWNGSAWINLTSGNASGIIGYTAPDKVYLTDINDKFGVGTQTPFGKMEVKADASIGVNDPIFHVVNKSGDTIFAVYNEGVRIYVQDDPAKTSGNKGGFAVGGFTPSKGGLTNEYLRVTPDSVRVYIEENPTNKASGNKGGFAVGGFTPSKIGMTNEYLRVTNDSTRIWTEDTIKGFGVRNIGVNNITSYMQLTPSNYFIGHESGKSITPAGLYNSFIGYKSGYADTSGSYNSFIGYMSGYHNLGGVAGDGERNSFMGYMSGYSNTIGRENVFIGARAGYSNTTGDYNVFIGGEAGEANTTGWNLTFIGGEAGKKFTSGVNNTFLGSFSGFYTTVSNYNTFLGAQAGMNNVTGEGNTNVGNLAGYYNQTGSSNACFGSMAGYFSSEGSNNTLIGKSAGQGNSSGSNNVMVGTGAGYSSYGTGNVFIGYNAGYNETTSAKLYIDNSNADSDHALIYGNFASNRLQVNNYLGIGEYPSYTLDVAGVTNLNKGLTGVALRVNGDEALWYDGTYFSWGYGGTYNYFADKVGIGLTNPSYKLELPNNSLVSLGCGRAYAWNTYSDSRVKKNQENLNYGINELMQLTPKRYDHYESDFIDGNLVLGNNYSKTIGLIAQEVYGVIPEAVTRPDNESSDLWSLDYQKFIPVLIKSIQDLQQQILLLQQENRTLKTDNMELQKKVNEIDELKAKIDKINEMIGFKTSDK